MLLAWCYWVGHSAKLSAVEDFSGIAEGTLKSQGARGGGILRNMTVVLHQLLVKGIGHVRPRGEIILPTTEAELRETMEGFHGMLAPQPGLPAVFAVDGTLIRCPAIPAKQLRHVDGVRESMQSWFGYKKYLCWLLLAACDANGLFTWIKSGVPGSVGDASAWNGSDLDTALKNCADKWPKLRLADGKEVAPFGLADTAFKLQPYLMKCHERISHDAEEGERQTLFNHTVIRTRRCASAPMPLTGAATSSAQVHARDIRHLRCRGVCHAMARRLHRREAIGATQSAASCAGSSSALLGASSPSSRFCTRTPRSLTASSCPSSSKRWWHCTTSCTARRASATT